MQPIFIIGFILLFLPFCSSPARKKNSNNHVSQNFNESAKTAKRKIPPYKKWGYIGLSLSENNDVVQIIGVMRNTPAQIADIQQNSQIISMNNRKITSIRDYHKYLQKLGVGAKVHFVLMSARKGLQEIDLLTITFPQDKQLFIMANEALRNQNDFLARHYFKRLRNEYEHSSFIEKIPRNFLKGS